MHTDLIDSLQHGLRASILRESVHHVADGNRDAQRFQRLLGSCYLSSECRDREYAVEEGLRAILK